MASNRHLGRIIVLQSLYEYEFRAKAKDPLANIDTIVAKNIEPYARALGDTEFVYRLARPISERFDYLDEELQPMAPEWPLNTIAAIDRNILRMGLYELEFTADAVPPKVAINEAVELAKSFGSDNSSKFVNGVLGTAYRKFYNEDESSPKETKENINEEETQTPAPGSNGDPEAPTSATFETGAEAGIETTSETAPETTTETISEPVSESAE